ncbi:hypothetical protein [Methylotuvimicrobium alcaliphilum]|uniref:Uncharacterized protein n=1 Tax=Methylotuvimicrobium alcaliphilum (strain DSM 19304 / NCIMB 14124 / VKM B-2133 / 20Z) TaxID=1091494 RepID=G4T434_META2|nr:hypothetical protein [Methylotuvimicrobium alcaliphilum]CCE23769.1 protein of unknown function [Methylotuvimicrobium alcaliphilum 20Z]
MLSATCLYTKIFETPTVNEHSLQQFNQIPRPFVIEPPPLGATHYSAGDHLQFSMVLAGPALENLPLIIYAWARAFSRGVSKSNTKGRLETVHWLTLGNGAVCCYEHGVFIKPPPDSYLEPSIPLFDAGNIDIVFETPVSIKKNGRVLKDSINAREFLMTLVRRYFLLVEFYGKDYVKPDFSALDDAIKRLDCNSNLSECNW